MNQSRTTYSGLYAWAMKESEEEADRWCRGRVCWRRELGVLSALSHQQLIQLMLTRLWAAEPLWGQPCPAGRSGQRHTEIGETGAVVARQLLLTRALHSHRHSRQQVQGHQPKHLQNSLHVPSYSNQNICQRGFNPRVVRCYVKQAWLTVFKHSAVIQLLKVTMALSKNSNLKEHILICQGKSFGTKESWIFGQKLSSTVKEIPKMKSQKT